MLTYQIFFMFRKVIIAEDYESSNISVQKIVEDLNIAESKFVSYCDDALTWIKVALANSNPYELLITDLSFDEDHRKQDINTGQKLIDAVRKVQPDIKILVFSVEKKEAIIEKLFKEQHIDAYVKKGRDDVRDLKKAIHKVFNDHHYLSAGISIEGNKNNAFEFTEYDTMLISLLANGELVKNIPDHLKTHQLKPNSISAVEKRLKEIKTNLNLNSNEQLIAISKDFGII